MAPPSFESRFFGTCGIVAAACLFLSPVPTCYKTLKQRSTQGFSALPYIAQMVESSWWALWAIAAGDRFEMLFNNALGASINLIYVLIFIVFAANEWRRRIWLQGAAATLLIGLGVLVALTVEEPDTIFGFAAVTLNTIKYASPLAVARDVIRTQSVEFMPLPLTLASLACGVFWGLHGLYLEDAFIYVPNVAGVAFATLQVCLYIRYGCCGSKSPPTDAAAPATDEQDVEAPPTSDPLGVDAGDASKAVDKQGAEVSVDSVPAMAVDEKDGQETPSEVPGSQSEDPSSVDSESAQQQDVGIDI